nr:hypothetical protein [Nonomuraea guangzhouensis]
MQPDRRQARLIGKLREQLADPSRMQLGAILACEDPAGVGPRLAPLLPLGVLACPVLLQHGHSPNVEGDHSVARLRLEIALLELPSVLEELLLHGQRSLLLVEVHPSDAAPFATAQAAERDEVEKCVQPMLSGDVEECAKLDRRPDHHG